MSDIEIAESMKPQKIIKIAKKLKLNKNDLILFGDNIAKIKRNHDISLSLCDGTYIINNGRHRIVYLKHYYENSEIIFVSHSVGCRCCRKVSIG